MASTTRPCVNHPRVETRVSCSSCGDPICPKCMRASPVGQKCPACARPARGARALGKPVHYVRAVAGGVAAAAVGGLLLAQVLAVVRFGGLILSALFGFAIGRVVQWGAQGQSQQPFVVIAVTCAVLGVAVSMLVRFGAVVPAGALFILAYPLAGWFAARGLQS